VTRVLHLTSGNLYGGIERLLSTLARLKHLAPEMEPEFGLCFQAQMWNELAQIGVPHYDLSPVRVSRFWTVWRARRNLKRLLQTHTFDVVVTHGCWPHALFAPVVRAAKLRLVNWVHDAPKGKHWSERWASLTPPDAIIVNSQYTASSVATVFPNVPHEVVYIPVESNVLPDRTAVRTRLRAELNTSPESVVILMASRMEAWKGGAVLLQALAKLATVPGWVAWIAGGPQRPAEHEFYESLQQIAQTSGIADRVRFLGHRSDVPGLMASADLYCQPNTGAEPFGLAFIEALASGLPVVTSDFGGGREIVDASCGILVPPGDVNAVANGLSGLIANAERRHQLGEAAPRRASALCSPSLQLPAIHRAIVSLR